VDTFGEVSFVLMFTDTIQTHKLCLLVAHAATSFERK